MKSEISYARLFYPELNRGKRVFIFISQEQQGQHENLLSLSLRFVERVSLHRSHRGSLIKPDSGADYQILTEVLLLHSEVTAGGVGGEEGALFTTTAKLHEDNQHSFAFDFPHKLNAKQREQQTRNTE